MKTAILKIPVPESCVECMFVKHHNAMYLGCGLGQIIPVNCGYNIANLSVQELDLCRKRAPFCPLAIHDEDDCPKCGKSMVDVCNGSRCPNYEDCPDGCPLCRCTTEEDSNNN